jgi:hypothetical protein
MLPDEFDARKTHELGIWETSGMQDGEVNTEYFRLLSPKFLN